MRHIWLALILTIGLAGNGWAAEKSVRTAHTVITADQMVTENNRSRVRFIGNVEAAHHDLRVKADKVEVYADERKETLEKIVADGNVVVTKGERKLTGGHAELLYAQRQVIVTGNPAVNDKGNVVSGEKIVYSYDKEGIMMGRGSGKMAVVPAGPPKQGRK